MAEQQARHLRLGRPDAAAGRRAPRPPAAVVAASESPRTRGARSSARAPDDDAARNELLRAPTASAPTASSCPPRRSMSWSGGGRQDVAPRVDATKVQGQRLGRLEPSPPFTCATRLNRLRRYSVHANIPTIPPRAITMTSPALWSRESSTANQTTNPTAPPAATIRSSRHSGVRSRPLAHSYALSETAGSGCRRPRAARRMTSTRVRRSSLPWERSAVPPAAGGSDGTATPTSVADRSRRPPPHRRRHIARHPPEELD